MVSQMEHGVDALLQAAQTDARHEVEIGHNDGEDGDGSSSLSDIEDNNIDEGEDDEAEASDCLSSPSDEGNDSEAETERLEGSPHKFRQQQDLIMSNQSYEHHTSESSKQIDHAGLNEVEEEEEDLSSSEDISLNESPDSPKSSEHGEPEPQSATVPTPPGESSIDGHNLLSVINTDTRKRKRSIMAGSSLDDDLGEPLRKRTGSIMTGNDYAIEGDANPDDEEDLSNPISGNVSGDEGGAAQEDEPSDDIEEPVIEGDLAHELHNIPVSPKRRGRKKKKAFENGVGAHDDPDGDIAVNGDHEVRNGEEDQAEIEGEDDADAATKNEEELERKRIALEQLSAIERQFTTFRDRLYDERLEQLNREEEMLRQDEPTHPGYLAMLQSIKARRDERIRIADTLREYEIRNLKTQSVAKRSQILAQYKQEVRDIREKKIEQLGKQWYEIQHDRRNHAGNVMDYALGYPTRVNEQKQNQMAYNTEVSILSGIAKYAGFPAAPTMASTSAAELEEDLEKMGMRRKHAQHHMQPASLPLQELAALRGVGSASRFKPAEEQFIEKTPWANPQHPSHAHLLQRQASAQQTPRTSSPFSQVQVQPRRHSNQHGSGLPISGTFSNNTSSLLHQSSAIGGRISPHNPFTNSTNTHTIVPSPLSGSRQTSLSPQQNRHPPALHDQSNLPHTQNVLKGHVNHSPPVAPSEINRNFSHDVRREQVAAMMSRS
ncbi:transcriptional regulatory protein DEP1 [Diplocarpon rosae]|nr:transcriptional regulatory protein DEP1 [Diplocarpon rosae]